MCKCKCMCMNERAKGILGRGLCVRTPRPSPAHPEPMAEQNTAG